MPLLKYGRPFFDVHLAMDTSSMSPWLPPETALSRVRSAIEAMAGAGRVSIEWSEDVRASATRVRVEEAAGGQIALDPAARGRLAMLVEAVIRKALFPDPASATAERPTGFRH